MARFFFAVLLASLLSGCTSAFFFPQRQMVASPADAGLSFEDVYFNSKDQTTLHGWWLPGTAAQGTVVFLHGNAENISTHFANVAWLPGAGFNVFVFDYRGYGRSGGEAELEGMIADATAALRYTTARLNDPQHRLIVFGQSLGGALAIHVAASTPLKARLAGVVVESAFADYRMITREKLASAWITWPFQWPLSLTVNNDFSPLASAQHIAPVPLLIVHSRTDPVIPVEHAQRLYERALPPTTLWITADGEHTALTTTRRGRQRLAEFLSALPPPGSTP